MWFLSNTQYSPSITVKATRDIAEFHKNWRARLEWGSSLLLRNVMLGQAYVLCIMAQPTYPGGPALRACANVADHTSPPPPWRLQPLPVSGAFLDRQCLPALWRQPSACHPLERLWRRPLLVPFVLPIVRTPGSICSTSTNEALSFLRTHGTSLDLSWRAEMRAGVSLVKLSLLPISRCSQAGTGPHGLHLLLWFQRPSCSIPTFVGSFFFYSFPYHSYLLKACL